MDASGLAGRQERAEDVCALPLVQRLAALLDQDPASINEGDPLPIGWHVCLFGPVAPQSQLATDGTPEGEALLPPIDGYPRRMAGGRRIRNLGSISIGSKVRRVSTITSVEPKQGRSGRFLLATVKHEFFAANADRPVVIEEYDTVFREAASVAAPASSGGPKSETVRPVAAASKAIIFDSRLLFRYSAVMFNAHRIHYDHAFATKVEGYPDLVVNGSLTVLSLLAFARQQAAFQPDAIVARNLLPLFAGRNVTLCVGSAAAGTRLWAENDAGELAVEVSVL